MVGIDFHDKYSYLPFKQVTVSALGVCLDTKRLQGLKAKVLRTEDTEKKIKIKEPLKMRLANNPGFLVLWLYKEAAMPLVQFLGKTCLFSNEH